MLYCLGTQRCPRHTVSGTLDMPSKDSTEKRRRDIVASRKKREKDFAKYLFINTRSSARRKGLKFTLTLKWFRKHLEPMTCSATGMKLSLDWSVFGCTHPMKPSVDRVDSDHGYTLSNCRVVAFLYNNAKHTYDDSMVLEMAKALINFSR